MSRASICGLLAAAVMVMAGCQCTGFRDRYGDVIDTINDHPIHFDWLYTPTLDLNLIGHRDWCASPINRFLCPACREKCPGCPHCRGHYHGTVVETSPVPEEADAPQDQYEEYDGEAMPPVPAPPSYDEEPTEPTELNLGTLPELAPLPLR